MGDAVGLIDGILAEREKRKAEKEAEKLGPVLGFRSDADVYERLRKLVDRTGIEQSELSRACMRRGVEAMERELRDRPKGRR